MKKQGNGGERNPNASKIRRSLKRSKDRKMGLIPATIVMKPLDDFLESLSRYGNITVDDEGVPTTFDYASGECYHTLPAARGFVEFFQLWERRKHKNLVLGPLISLINDIENNVPLKQEWIKDAQLAVNRMRNALMGMSISEAADLTRTAQIKFELDRQRAKTIERSKRWTIIQPEKCGHS